MNERQLAVLADTPSSAKLIMQRAFEAKCSPRAAIKAFCLHCTAYMRAEVTNCTSLGCPLYAFRPYQTGADDDSGTTEAAGE